MYVSTLIEKNPSILSKIKRFGDSPIHAPHKS